MAVLKADRVRRPFRDEWQDMFRRHLAMVRKAEADYVLSRKTKQFFDCLLKERP